VESRGRLSVRAVNGTTGTTVSVLEGNTFVVSGRNFDAGHDRCGNTETDPALTLVVAHIAS
jgi:hypothetical protein